MNTTQAKQVKLFCLSPMATPDAHVTLTFTEDQQHVWVSISWHNRRYSAEPIKVSVKSLQEVLS